MNKTSKENNAPRYVAYHTAGGYRRKPKWFVCDSADPRCSDPPPAIAVCYEEEHAERILEALNGSRSVETSAAPLFPPTEPWPHSLGEQCLQYWGRIERRCQLTQGHEGACYFCVPAYAIRTDIPLDRLSEKATTVPGTYVDLNLVPIGECNRCGRKVWKADALGKLDEMTQPSGFQCGGRFVAL